MILTRRELFRNLKDNLIENFQDSVQVFLNKTPVGEIHEFPTWISLGNISGFPPDCSTLVNNGKHILISKSEGFYVLDLATYKTEKKEPRMLIRFGKAGVIMMNTIDICPAGTVLSVLTGELVEEEL